MADSSVGSNGGGTPFRRYFGRLLLFAVPVVNVAAALFRPAMGSDAETKAFIQAVG